MLKRKEMKGFDNCDFQYFSSRRERGRQRSWLKRENDNQSVSSAGLGAAQRVKVRVLQRVPCLLSPILIALMYNANSGFTTIMNEIVGSFFRKEIISNETQINLIMTLPVLIMIPGVAISGFLAQNISLRTIAIFSWIMFGITGIVLYFSTPNIFAFLAIRGLMGLAIGLCRPISRSLPSKLLEPSRNTQVIGFISMGDGIMAVVLSLVFDYIAINWRYCLLIFPALSIIFITLALIFILKQLPEKKETQIEFNVGEASLFSIVRPILILCIAQFCIYSISAVIQIKTSIHVAHVGIGGVEYAGFISSVTAAGIIGGVLLFKRIYRIMKCKLFSIASLGIAMSYYVFASANKLVVMAASSFIIGWLAMGTYYARYGTHS